MQKADTVLKEMGIVSLNMKKSFWEVTTNLVTGIAISYKYLMIGQDRLIKWETSKTENRTITPLGYEMIVNDGEFGRDPDGVWIDEGWLSSEIQIRIALGYSDPLNGEVTPPITGIWGDQPLSLHIFNKSYTFRDLVHLPIEDNWHEVVFYVTDIFDTMISIELFQLKYPPGRKNQNGHGHSSLELPFSSSIGSQEKHQNLASDINDQYKRIGFTKIIPQLFKDMRGNASLPLFNSALQHCGEFNFKYLVVTPFKHHLNNLAAIWKSYTNSSKPIGKAVGHRGCGTTRTSIISENTILSFLTAANYGADYIEFDVQITNDMVPVINHDFHICTNGEEEKIFVPVVSLTKKQFKTIRPQDKSNEYASRISKALIHKPGILKRSRSLNDLINNNFDKESKKSETHSHNVVHNSLNRPDGDENNGPIDSNNIHSNSSRDPLEVGHRHPQSAHYPIESHSPLPIKQVLSGEFMAHPSVNDHEIGSTGHHTPLLDIAPNQSDKVVINPRDAFATLAETLRVVPSEIGFVIELKYPSERHQMKVNMRYHERNLYTDAVLNSIFSTLNNPAVSLRKILLISFDPDMCVLLSQKQPRYPVLMLLCLGNGMPITDNDNEVEGYDPRCHNFDVALKFATIIRLKGLICDAAYILKNPDAVQKAHEQGHLLMTYGKQNMNAFDIAKQKNYGVDSLIMDNMVHLSREARHREQMSSLFFADYGRQEFKLG